MKRMKYQATLKMLGKSRSKISEKPLHIMLIPGIIVTLIYAYLPMYGIKIAFENFNPANGLFGEQEWVGLEHFRFFINSRNFYIVMRNTLFLSSMKIVTGLSVPIVVSLLLNEMGNQSIKRLIQTIIYLPHFLSWVILSGILITMLRNEGIINDFLALVGIGRLNFLGSNQIFPWVLIVSNVWKEFGWGTIIYLATIAGIDPNLYEAAFVDGATRLQQTWHITLPNMRYIIILAMVLSLKRVLSAGFDQVLNMTMNNRVVTESSEIIDTFVYKMGLINQNFSLATAVGLFKSIISLVLITVSYNLAYRLTGYRVF